MRNNIKWMFLILLCVGCGDIIEEDIEKENVQLVAPGDLVVTFNQDVQFVWESILDADNYTFQLGKPSFENLEEIVLDTVVNENGLSRKLAFGKYCWRVKANNSTSSSKYYSRSFEVMKDLSTDNIEITSPIEAFEASSEEVIFMWKNLEGATSYKLQIVSPSFDGIDNMIRDTVITVNEFREKLDIGKYQWRIKGLNAKTESQYVTRSLERKDE